MLDTVSNESYFKSLTDIASFFNCKLLINKQKSLGNGYYTVTATSKISLNILTDYFSKYLIFSSKYLDYKD
jgi:LAGLIDADG endonuclease